MTAIPQWLSVCCPQATGGNYGWPGCACPQVTVIAVLTAGLPQLQGIMEFGTQSAPRNVYRQYNISSGWTASSVSTSATWTKSFAGLGTFDFSTLVSNDDFQQSETNANWTAGSGTINYTEGFAFLSLSNGTTSFAGFTSGTAYGELLGAGTSSFTSSSAFAQTFHIDSPTVARITVASGSQSGVQPGTGTATTDSITAGTVTITLSAPDSDAAAIARASLVAGSPIFELGNLLDDQICTVQETRDATTIQFNYQTGVAAFLIDGLIPGRAMKLTQVWVSRTAVGDGTPLGDAGFDAEYGSSWSTYVTVVTTFTPTATDYLIGGTTSDAPGSISPADVTPTAAMPFAAGLQIKLAAVYIEPA